MLKPRFIVKLDILFVKGSIVPKTRDDCNIDGIGVTHPTDDGNRFEPTEFTDIVIPLFLYAGQEPPFPLLSMLF